MTLGFVSSARQCVMDLGGELSSARECIFNVWGEAFHGHFIAPSVSTTDRVVPRPTFKLELFASPGATPIDLTKLTRKLRIVRPFNGKSTIDFTLRNPFESDDRPIDDLPSDMCPPGYNAYAFLIRQHNGTSDSHYLQVTITVADEEWESPAFFPGCPGYDGKEIQWGGEDRTTLCESATLSMSNLVAEQGTSLKAKAAAEQEAEEFGFKILWRGRDYRIGVLSREGGSLRACLDKKAKPFQLASRWVRLAGVDTLLYEPANTSAPPARRLLDRLHLRKKLNIRELPRPLNQFTCTRLEPTGNQIGEAEGDQVGRDSSHVISFDVPARTIVIEVVKALNGQLIDWVFFDAGNRSVGGGGGGGPQMYQGAAPAVRAEFTYYPNIANAEYSPKWEILARGGTLRKKPGSVYNYTKVSDALQIWHGPNPSNTNVEDAIIWDEQDLEPSTIAYRDEAERHVFATSFETRHMDPWAGPGCVIHVTDMDTLQAARQWFVEQDVLEFDELWFNQAYECHRGLQGAELALGT